MRDLGPFPEYCHIYDCNPYIVQTREVKVTLSQQKKQSENWQIYDCNPYVLCHMCILVFMLWFTAHYAGIAVMLCRFSDFFFGDSVSLICPLFSFFFLSRQQPYIYFHFFNNMCLL